MDLGTLLGRSPIDLPFCQVPGTARCRGELSMLYLVGTGDPAVLLPHMIKGPRFVGPRVEFRTSDLAKTCQIFGFWPF